VGIPRVKDIFALLGIATVCAAVTSCELSNHAEP
jgi:hypothetical protein